MIYKGRCKTVQQKAFSEMKLYGHIARVVSVRNIGHENMISCFFTSNPILIPTIPSKNGSITRNRFLIGKKMNKANTLLMFMFGIVWEDIKPLINVSKERLRFTTQKPVKLLEQIIKASSNKGDTVLDPFCGCRTTLEASIKLD